MRLDGSGEKSENLFPIRNTAQQEAKSFMKNLLKLSLLGLLAHSICLNAQTSPQLQITQGSPTTIQINWTNQVGTTYRLWFTTNLALPFSSWSPLEDAFSEDAIISADASTLDAALGFFRLQIPTNTDDVRIFSPSDGQTVSGEIGIGMGAQIGAQVQGVNLYLDDALVGYINSGGARFDLDTTHFENGTHTLYVGAVDTANNETLSSSITLDFENPVRWLDACSMFNSFVPIDVTSDIYPADWLVSVTDTNGTIVRTIAGSTTDGIIQTSWDGTDDNGQQLPVENLYQITVDVAETSGASSMVASTFASTLSATSVSSKLNPHGVPEFTVVKPVPNPLIAYLETVNIYNQLTPEQKFIYPPLPAPPANDPYATTTEKMSARELFQAVHHTSSITSSVATGTATPAAGSPLRSGSTKDLVWWENPWPSAQTVLAYAGDLGFIQSGYVSSDMLSLRTFIDTLAVDLSGNRNVYQDTIYTLSSAGDFSDLTNHLAELSPNNVRAFYFYGHGNTNGNAIGTQSRVVGAKAIATVLGNYVVVPASAPGKPTLVTHHAYSFVFLDGCNTGLGNFPEAFGIPKNITGPQLNASGGLRKRAFMGWGAPVTHSIIGNYPLEWSFKFWRTWLGDGDDSTVALQTAVDAPPFLSS
jgi:hypothetical protein